MKPSISIHWTSIGLGADGFRAACTCGWQSGTNWSRDDVAMASIDHKSFFIAALRVWTNGRDTVIAVDLDDVHAVLREHYQSNEFDGDMDWKAYPDGKSIAINTLDGPNGDERTTKTAAEWIASDGRGFLCSTEY